MPLDLDDENAALAELLRDTIERDRFPLSPRIKRLRGILAKLGIGSAPAVPYPPPEPPGERSMKATYFDKMIIKSKMFTDCIRSQKSNWLML